MKRAIIFALVLLAGIAAPLSGVAYADYTSPQGEVQARSPHRARLADSLSLVSLPRRGPERPIGEEQLGIAVSARGAVTPVRRVGGPRQVTHRCLPLLGG